MWAPFWEHTPAPACWGCFIWGWHDKKEEYGARSGTGLRPVCFGNALTKVYPNRRIKRDVLRYCPDLVVVSFGLNDCGAGLDNLDNYANALREIFKQIKESGAECIFLTQNYMATKVSCHIKDEFFVNLARQLSEIQNSGVLKKYFEKAKEVCSDMSVDVCDLYEVWEKLEKAEVDVTELLSNKMNHPVKEYHYYIAIKLLEKIIEV